MTSEKEKNRLPREKAEFELGNSTVAGLTHQDSLKQAADSIYSHWELSANRYSNLQESNTLESNPWTALELRHFLRKVLEASATVISGVT
jgi:hypothetical protein